MESPLYLVSLLFRAAASEHSLIHSMNNIVTLTERFSLNDYAHSPGLVIILHWLKHVHLVGLLDVYFFSDLLDS